MVTDLDIARWRLRTQHLSPPSPTSAEQVVRSLLAVQAENPSQSAWAVATRTTSPDATDLAAALEEGRVFRTHVIRPTWHYVAAEDLVWLTEVTAPGARRPFVEQLKAVPGGEARLDRLRGLVVDALAGTALTRPQVAGRLAEEEGEELGGHELMLLMGDLELRGLVCSGPPVGEVHTYALVADRVPEPRRLGREEALAELALRYVTGHGPVVVEDLAYWATLTPADAKAGLTAAADRLESFEHAGRTWWHAPGQEPPREPAEPVAHLLQILDETYRGYATASRWVLDTAGVVPRGRETSMGMVLVDAQLVAAMKRTLDRRQASFTLAPHASWTASMQPAVEDAAARYAAYLGREPDVGIG